jgi:hypothetical protein
VFNVNVVQCCNQQGDKIRNLVQKFVENPGKFSSLSNRLRKHAFHFHISVLSSNANVILFAASVFDVTGEGSVEFNIACRGFKREKKRKNKKL